MMELASLNTNDPDITNYSIKFLKGKTMIATNELLKPVNITDIGSITIYLENYIKESENPTQEQIENIMFTEVLSTLKR